MMDDQALYNYAVSVVNDYFKGNNVTNTIIKELDKKLREYFIEYKKKYNEDPARSWLARAIEEDQFFYYGNYTNIQEFLNNEMAVQES
jgi:hypothetical protein